jgi:hypothetical protein
MIRRQISQLKAIFSARSKVQQKYSVKGTYFNPLSQAVQSEPGKLAAKYGIKKNRKFFLPLKKKIRYNV